MLFSKSGLFTGVKVISVAWFLLVLVSILAVFSGGIMIMIRYLLVPKTVLNHDIDFIPRSVRDIATSSLYKEQIALLDLNNVKNMVHQDYSIEVVLGLPLSPDNRSLKNFKVSGMLANKPWQTGKSARNPEVHDNSAATYNQVDRMASLPYRSDLVENARSLLLFPLYLFGVLEEKESLSVTLWNNAATPLKDQSYMLLALPEELWVASASLRLSANLHGVRWLLEKFPIYTFLIGSATILIIQMVGLLAFGLWVYSKLSGSKDLDSSDSTAFQREIKQETAEPKQKLQFNTAVNSEFEAKSEQEKKLRPAYNLRGYSFSDPPSAVTCDTYAPEEASYESDDKDSETDDDGTLVGSTSTSSNVPGFGSTSASASKRKKKRNKKKSNNGNQS